jgi:pyruvate formate lyase activating enzyme
MKICGFNKTTLLDYPGKVAASVFLGRCNFRCPFCHNSSLVLHADQQPEISRKEILDFLKKRQGILDGVCISGGEPTLAEDLADFLKEIKELGYEIKLDTNGSRPYVVKKLIKDGLVDKIAMDIKACPDNYQALSGLKYPDMGPIRETAALLMENKIDYEFRTTVVKELHTEKDLRQIGRWLAGAKAYYLQAYRDSDDVLQPGFCSYSRDELEHFREILLETIPLVEIRGID